MHLLQTAWSHRNTYLTQAIMYVMFSTQLHRKLTINVQCALSPVFWTTACIISDVIVVAQLCGMQLELHKHQELCGMQLELHDDGYYED